MAGPADIEARTLAIGRELFAATRRHHPRLLSRAWIDDRAMAWTMRDDRLKAQLFRFVDALPGLRTRAEIATHLREYLEPVVAGLPGRAARVFGGLLAATRREPSMAALAAWAATVGSRQLARKFIVGSDVRETVAAVARLRGGSLAFTVDLLGEAILSEAEADRYQGAYLALIAALADAASGWADDALLDGDGSVPVPRVNVSIKLSALTCRFEPCDPVGTSRRVLARLRPILELARARGVFVNVDMEQSAYKPTTIAIFKKVLEEQAFRDWPDVGIAIQAYLRSSDTDLSDLHDWAERRAAPVWIRLVKGAYWDYECAMAAQNGWRPPVFTGKAATDASYERLAGYLIERREVLRPAFASHNARSIAKVLALAEAAKVPQRGIEFQMLYGMAGPLARALIERGERVRVYAPFGDLLPGMAYLVRRLLENTSNQSFVRAGFLEGLPEEHLLMDPATASAQTSRIRLDRFTNEPPLDFSLPAPRAAMAAALAAVAGRLGRDYPLVIGGQAVTTPNVIESLDPSHRRTVVGRVARAGAAEARRAVDAAAAAFPAWRDAPASTRAELLRRVAGVLAARRCEIGAWIVREVGKSWREADADVAEAIDFCRYYALGAEALAAPRRIDLPGEENDLVHEPRGVAVVIAPWNFPLAILCGMAAAALATGNTVVMKPAEQSPVVASLLMEAFAEAGFPAGVVNYLPGLGEEVGPALLDHPATAIIAFTGSQQVGLAINRRAAEPMPGRDHVVRVIAEMGGKNAIIVDDDADLDEAVAGVMHSAFGYQGQKCSACSRAIVLAGVHDAFLARLVEATRGWELAPAEDPAHGIGPLIDDEARMRVLAAVARGKREARLVFPSDGDQLGGAGGLADEGHYVAPHIFADVRPESFLAQDEIFGPLLAVVKARDLDHALAIANGTRYALTGGCYSRSPTTLERVRREFRVGNLYLNRRITGALVGRQPFGGYKLSGIGSKAGGDEYLLQFVVPRTITENTMRHGFAPERGAPGVDNGASGGDM